MSATLQPEENRNVLRSAVVYFGGAWVFIEVFNFLIDKYGLSAKTLDIIIILVIFGLPATIIHSWFYFKFVRKSIILHSVNGIIALSVVTSYLVINPDKFQPTQIGLLNFERTQKRAAESVRSIAVLPFSNYTGNADKEFLSAGIHDALISEMGQIGAIRIISKTSTLPYLNSEKTIQKIASELGVDAIIEGSMLVADDTIRLQLKLISAFPEELQLWTRTYDASMNDLLNVYGDMTKNIAEEINITITPSEEKLISKDRTVNPDAYEAYLKGKYSMGMLSREGIQSAMGHFQRAIEIDPQFAQAYGGLAGIWAFLKQMDIVTTDEANPKIISNLALAMELDSTLADVHYWDAIRKVWTDYDWPAGEIAFKKALAINPGFSEARGLYANFLMAMSRLDESRVEMNKALEMDPNNPFIIVLNGILLTFEGNYQASIDLLSPIQKAMPSNALVGVNLLIAYYQLGEEDKCFEQVKLKIKLEGYEELIPEISREYQRNGFQKAILKTAQMLEKTDNTRLATQTMQFLYAMGGDEDKTLDWLEKGFIRKDSDMPFIKAAPLLKPYLNNSRFIEVTKRMNL
jgi:adenylate cyclase